MRNKLTKKEKGFAQDFAATGNGVQSALKNYDTESYKTASNIASTNLDKPRVQKAIAEMIPDDLLGQKHLALLNKIDEKGEIDVQAVSKGLDMGYKIKGTYAPEKTVNMNIEVESSEEIKKLADQLNELNRSKS